MLTPIIDLYNLQVFRVVSPVPGLWTLSVTSFNVYTISVTASSYVDFTYRFVEAVGGAHPGYRPVDGKPLAGESFVLNLYAFHTWPSVLSCADVLVNRFREC